MSLSYSKNKNNETSKKYTPEIHRPRFPICAESDSKFWEIKFDKKNKRGGKQVLQSARVCITFPFSNNKTNRNKTKQLPFQKKTESFSKQQINKTKQRQNKTKRNKTKQNKTIQNKTKQNETKQNKTK